jgi:hypothetical protein
MTMANAERQCDTCFRRLVIQSQQLAAAAKQGNDVVAKKHAYREQRPEVHGDVEGKALVGPAGGRRARNSK